MKDSVSIGVSTTVRSFDAKMSAHRANGTAHPGERVRVLFVLPSPVRGGAEEVVLALIQQLPREQFQLALACPQHLLRSMRSDISGLDVETRGIEADSWLRIKDVWRLAAFIRSFRPHVVNPHLFRATLVAAPLAKALGVARVIETYHGREAWRLGRATGAFAVDRCVSRFVDRVIAVSEAARDFLVDTKRIPASKIQVIANGRALTAFTPGDGSIVRRELSISPDAQVVGVVGRLEPQKGHEFLLRGFSHVLQEFPSAVLLLVGDGLLEATLRKLASELDIESHVIFAGFRTDVPRCFDAMDLVVLPSLYEGMPLVAIEAAAMARAVVATAVDGSTEVIEDGDTGLLVPPEDPEALATAINELLESPGRRAEMGQRARRRALGHFTLERQVHETGRSYRDCVLGSAQAGSTAWTS